MMFTNDPVADFHRYDAEQERKLEELPVCEYCRHPIQDEHLYDINDEIICEQCLKDNFRKETEDYVQ